MDEGGGEGAWLEEEERIKETAHMCTVAADLAIIGPNRRPYRTTAELVRIAVETAIRAGVRNGWLAIPAEVPDRFRPDLGLKERG